MNFCGAREMHNRLVIVDQMLNVLGYEYYINRSPQNYFQNKFLQRILLPSQVLEQV